MSALHEPLKAEMAARITAAEAAAGAGNGDDAVFAMLDAFAALGRDTAQRSWLVHHEAEDRDERMKEDEDGLVFECLKTRFSEVYPELPGQVEAVLREAFDDEHFRLEDPLGWEEMNADLPDQPGARS